ncbi:MAG TPA: NAD-dependent epimerase/dehydratase family protein [Actinomycetota bacterium]|nr:NAD-dependent epimerase/dehydratase family protein [Actinomycetota bacterium]
MRIAITGATGNVGTSVLNALVDDPAVDSIVGIARRLPTSRVPKTTWVAADVTESDLVPILSGADVVIHLAWLIQPSRDLELVRRTNVDGSIRVFEAAAAAKVPALVYASSVGAYSPGPKEGTVDESWPARGIATSFYSRHKGEVEAVLDEFEPAHPEMRIVRLRPALIFKKESGAEVRRLFFGPFLPNRILRRGWIPVIPNIPGLRFQAVHSLDVGEAYRLAAMQDVRGAFNITADPILDFPTIAEILGARVVRVSPRVVRAGANITWKLRLQPTPPGWVDMAMQAPLMDGTRATTELGWKPTRTSIDAVKDLIDGLRESAGLDTPPLDPHAGGRLRHREITSGVGSRQM